MGRPLAARRGPAAIVLFVAASLLASVAAPGVGAQSDPEAERDDVRRRKAAVAEQLDVLQASDAEIDAALSDLEGRVAAQQAAVADAEAAADAAAAEQRGAEAALRRARRDVDLLETAIAEMAIASYVNPPSGDLVQSLQATTLSDAVLQQTYLDARAQRDLDLLDLLEQAERIAVRRADEVEQAVAAADAALAAADAELVALRGEQDRQQAFAADLQDRIDASLAEAAVLADLDAELSAEIEARQAALLARLPPPPPPVPEPPVTPTPSPTTTTSVVAADPVDDAADDLADDPPAPTTTTPTTAPPTTTPPSTSTPPLRTVRGITVHADIAGDVEALLAAAAADGVSLSGWGYRSTQRQIELRIANCGPTSYDIWLRPAGSCRPPTAVPGRSLHEQGRAIDFTYNGRTITSRSNPGFRWLADNAANYGLFNLPSEPWHWSTSGG